MPRILDLFCKAGGASMGYHRAGFEVVGVDIEPQPNYPFEFHQADAFEFFKAHWREFDAYAASPPCQDHSSLKSMMPSEKGTGWMLDAMRGLFIAMLPKPSVLENVMGADMRRDLVLCADRHFGLRTVRHRQFEIRGFTVPQPPHPKGHSAPTSTVKRRKALDAGEHISVTGDVGSYVGVPCMGIDWMTGNELSQAIPPAYTEYIGKHLMEALCGTDGVPRGNGETV